MYNNSTRTILNQRVQIHDDGSREYWRDVPGYKGQYRISDWGRLKSLGRVVLRAGRGGKTTVPAKYITRKLRRGGYYRIALLDREGNREDILIHRVVLLAFVGPCPKGMECCHWDGNPMNNRLDNLRWDTAKNNQADRLRHGRGVHVTNPKGEDIWWAKLTEKDVKRIRKLYASGRHNQTELSEIFGVYQTLISRIIRRKAWCHVR